MQAYRALGLAEPPTGANFVMYDGADPVAVMCTHLSVHDEPALNIDLIRFADGLDDGDKKFFLHAMFFKFREGTPILIRACKDDALRPFGFEDDGDMMRLYSGDIDLYYNCGGKLHG